MFIQAFYQPSRSLAHRLYNAEFDDALVDQAPWKNSRYEGSKLTAKEINYYSTQELGSSCGVGCASIVGNALTDYNPGIGTMVITDIPDGGISSFQVGGYLLSTGTEDQPPSTNNPGTFQVEGYVGREHWKGDSIHPGGLDPIIKNETTALYIANTVIGGTEDPQFATIKNHSYININQILLINPNTDATQLLEKSSEGFEAFHRFITTDLPTAGSFSIKIIDESISHNLKGANQYKVKMNKGFLLKSFNFKQSDSDPQLTEHNSMFLYKSGSTQEGTVIEGTQYAGAAEVQNGDFVRFRYGLVALLAAGYGDFSGNGYGHHFQRERIGPSFASSSIIENKFTKQYYSGSFGLINEPSQPQGTTNTDIIKTSGLGSASRFIGLNSLKFLRNNNTDPTLSEQERTELHITFFEGEKDFSLSEEDLRAQALGIGSGSRNDERSIGTFEVDSNQDDLDKGGICNDYLPKTHEIRLKGRNDTRFMPRGHTFEDDFHNGYVTSSATIGGCIAIDAYKPYDTNQRLQYGLNVDQVNNAEVYIQGGALGSVGYVGFVTASNVANYSDSIETNMSASNYYSGSFRYELSWLDKDHTLITNLNKEEELFDGIGVKGIVIVPKYIHPKIKNNINFYLQQAGILDSSPNTQVQLTNDG